MELNITRPIVIFDLETTGLQVGKDRIVEFSFIKITPDGKEEIWTDRVNPEIKISPESQSIHGISDKDVADKPTFKDIAKKINSFIGNADLAGYNSNKFDVPMLVEEFLKAGVDFDIQKRHLVDVQNIFHKMEPRTLAAAYKFYCNKSIVNAHSADADTIATYEVLKAQISRYDGVEYEDRDGNISKPIVNNIEKLAQFSKMRNFADLAGHIVFNENEEEVFNFGKNRNKKVEDVFLKEAQYYDWMMRSDFPEYTKKIITAIKLRNFNKRI